MSQNKTYTKKRDVTRTIIKIAETLSSGAVETDIIGAGHPPIVTGKH